MEESQSETDETRDKEQENNHKPKKTIKVHVWEDYTKKKRERARLHGGKDDNLVTGELNKASV